MQIAILLYERMTALDAMGPYEVLSRLPDAKVKFVAGDPGPVTTDTGFLRLVADFGIADVSGADLLLIPGGPGESAVRRKPEVLDWVRQIHASSEFTTSVCTGALILGAAGILEGLPATTHWARLERLRDFGAEPVRRRMVEAGKVVTAAGVSAGIDMALFLAQKRFGEDVARAVQLGIEYDPEPPLAMDQPEDASPAVRRLLTDVVFRRPDR